MALVPPKILVHEASILVDLLRVERNIADMAADVDRLDRAEGLIVLLLSGSTAWFVEGKISLDECAQASVLSTEKGRKTYEDQVWKRRDLWDQESRSDGELTSGETWGCDIEGPVDSVPGILP